MDDRQKLLNIIHKMTPIKIIEANDSIDRIKITGFYNKLEECLRSDGYKNNVSMGPISICLNSETSGSGVNMLDHIRLGNYLKSGASRKSNVLVVDYDGRLIENQDEIMINNPADAARNFDCDNITLFFIAGERLEIYYKAKIIECIPNIFTHIRSIIVSDMTLPISEYRAIIDAHFKNKIERKRYLVYWKNKKERLLVPAPERIFANDLGYYLSQYVADGHVDSECNNAWTDDRTDIRVVRDEDRHIYIFEIKWLGTSISEQGNKTTHEDTRADAGIVQLNTYLNEETLSVCGVLVLYDARKENTEIKYNPTIKRDARIDTPLRYYLISESASEQGVRIAKQKKSR